MGRMSELEGMLKARRLFAGSRQLLCLTSAVLVGRKIRYLAGRGEQHLTGGRQVTPSLFLPPHRPVLSLTWWRHVSYPNIRLTAPEDTEERCSSRHVLTRMSATGTGDQAIIREKPDD